MSVGSSERLERERDHDYGDWEQDPVAGKVTMLALVAGRDSRGQAIQ